MKKFTSLLIAILVSIAAFGQSKKEFKLKDFDSIEAGFAFEVHIHKKSEFSVTALANAEDLTYVKAYLKGNILVLEDGRKSNWNWFNRGNRGKVVINVGMPELKNAEISGAVNAEIYGFTNQDFMNLEASGASKIIVDNLEVNKFNLDASGASNVKISGSAYKFNIDCSGASNIKAKEFKVRDCDADASGASNITIYPTNSLIAEATGASNIYYVGTPVHLETESHAASNIKKISE
ncbi:MAG: hypothetical protein RIR51_1252 [Bacteroidota bacterium]|jgi:hypothetical protein